MEKNISREELVGHWIHSYEEDTPTESVYRPSSFPFPPSRGRRGFEFRQDGSVVAITLGSRDVPGQVLGHWELHKGDQMILQLRFPAEPLHQWEVVSAGEDRLVIQRPIE